MKKFLLLLLVSGTLLAVGGTTTRKCNGQPGTRVPMGVM